jgi:hypothetical protein
MISIYSCKTLWPACADVVVIEIEVNHHCALVALLLSPIPQHTVSLYTFIYQESAWSGRSGLSLREYPETIELGYVHGHGYQVIWEKLHLDY